MLFCLSGKGTCQWNGAGWKKDPGRLLHNKKTSHTYPWNLYGKTHLVSFIHGFCWGFFPPKPVQDGINCVVKIVSILRDLIWVVFLVMWAHTSMHKLCFLCLGLLCCTLKTLDLSISSSACINRKIFWQFLNLIIFLCAFKYSCPLQAQVFKSEWTNWGAAQGSVNIWD